MENKWKNQFILPVSPIVAAVFFFRERCAAVCIRVIYAQCTCLRIVSIVDCDVLKSTGGANIFLG